MDQCDYAEWNQVSCRKETKNTEAQIFDLLRANGIDKDENILKSAATWFLRFRYIYVIKQHVKSDEKRSDERNKERNPMDLSAILN